GRAPERPIAQPGGGLDQLADLVQRQDVRRPPWQFLGAKDRRRDLMAWVLGPRVSREPNDGPEPTRALRHRRSAAGPFNREIGGHLLLASCRRERGGALSLGNFAPQGKSHRAGGPGGHPDETLQHGCTSGHGCAIDWRAVTSTFA